MLKQFDTPAVLFLDAWVSNEIARALIANLALPVLRILAIVIAALLLRRLARRVIDEAIARAKAPGDMSISILTDRVRDYIHQSDATQTATEAARREQRADSLGGLARSVVNVAIIATATIMVLSELGVELAPLIAGAGIIGLAVGFGAQDLVKDFLSGMFMLLEDQFGVGDIIEVDGNTGVVEAITLRSTRLRTIDGTLWHVPNGSIRKVGNRSQEWARALFDVDVSYDTDVDVALVVLGDVAQDLAQDPEFAPFFMEEPAVVGVLSLGSDSVTIRAMAQVVPGQQWALGREFSRRIKRAFDTAGIEFPFPQRTVWLRTEQPLSLGSADTPVWNTTPPDQAARDAARQAAPVDTTAPTDTDEPS